MHTRQASGLGLGSLECLRVISQDGEQELYPELATSCWCVTDSLYRIHIVSIVTFPDGSKYHDDVSFGGDGPTMAMPLVDGIVHQNMGAQQVRLVRDWVPTQTRRTEESKLWIYQYRNNANVDWNSFYAFPELEFMAADWEVVNWWTGSSPRSWQTSTLLVIKFLRKQDKTMGESARDQEIFGK